MKTEMIQGNLIRLRQPKRSDAESIRAYISDPKVSGWLPKVPHPYTIENAYEWIRLVQQKRRLGQELAFCVELLDHPGVIGGISLMNINRLDKNAEIGYWVARPFWRQGLGTEAVRLACGYAFKEQKLKRLYAWVHSKNSGSYAILERVGFRREGTCRKASFLGRRWGDVYLYGMLPGEFRFDF